MSTFVRFTNKISGEATDHLLWSFGDGTTSTSMSKYVYHSYEPGTYKVTLEGWSVSGQYDKEEKTIIIPPDITYFAADSKTIYRSNNPETGWQLTNFDSTTHTQPSIAVGNGIVAVLCRNTVTYKSTIAISSDLGDTWTYYNYNDERYQDKIRFCNGYFLCSCPSTPPYNKLARSIDAVNWTSSTNNLPAYGLHEASYLDGTYTFILGSIWGYDTIRCSNDLDSFNNVEPLEVNSNFNGYGRPIQSVNNRIFIPGRIYLAGVANYSAVITSENGKDFSIVRYYSNFLIGYSANDTKNKIANLFKIWVDSNIKTVLSISTDGGASFSDPVIIDSLVGDAISHAFIFYANGTFIIHCVNSSSELKWFASKDLSEWMEITPDVPGDIQLFKEVTST